MVIIVDGYNLLKNIFSHQKDNLAKQRDYLVRQLAFYKHGKKDTITDVVIVFDGGLIDKATREVRQGVVLIYAGRGKSADRWIEKFVDRNKHRTMVLVSNDRQLVSRCKNRGADAMKVEEFCSILQRYLAQNTAAEENALLMPFYGVQKYVQEPTELDELSPFLAEEVNILMEQASLHKSDKKEAPTDEIQSRKGPAQQLSKETKRKQLTLKKLL